MYVTIILSFIKFDIISLMCGICTITDGLETKINNVGRNSTSLF